MTDVDPIGFEATPSLLQSSMIPIGGIINWSGTILSIPGNFQLCDGTGGTPDLRDRFIVGAGLGEAVGDTGGNVTHFHTVNDVDFTGVGPGTDIWHAANDDAKTNVADGRPPFYALAYIQRIS